MENEKSNIEKIIENTIKNLDGQIKTQKIVGEKIKNDKGQTVIPISKVTIGLLSGGGEYGDIKITKELGNHFAGGTFTLCQIKPTCFVIDNGDGFNVVSSNGDSFEKLMILLGKIIRKIKL